MLMNCIICKKEFQQEELDNEHVIPESIGGSFILNDAICKKCNHLLGTKVDSLLVDNPQIIWKRNQYKIPNKDGIVPNIFGLGTEDGTGKKILWKADKEGNPSDLHLYPHITIEEQSDGSLIIEIDADESYGEEAILKMVKRKLDRMGRKISMEDLKEQLTPMDHGSKQPTINYRDKINILEYKADLIKIAYEMTYYWLGLEYLNDEIGENLRKFLYDLSRGESVSDCLDKYQIRGHSEFFQNKPFYEITDYEERHYVILLKVGSQIRCYIKIFNIIQAFIPVSLNSSSYPNDKLLDYKCMIFDFKNLKCFEPSDFDFDWGSVNLDSFGMMRSNRE